MSPSAGARIRIGLARARMQKAATIKAWPCIRPPDAALLPLYALIAASYLLKCAVATSGIDAGHER